MIERLSPHHGARIATRPVTLILLHADAAASEEGTLSWFQDPKSKVSYHVLIKRDGTPVRVVPDHRVAWHAGESTHPVCLNPKSVNAESLGLSFANRHDGHELITAAQMATARQVIATWKAAFPTIRAIATHAQVAPKRKTDPELIPNFRLTDYPL